MSVSGEFFFAAVFSAIALTHGLELSPIVGVVHRFYQFIDKSSAQLRKITTPLALSRRIERMAPSDMTNVFTEDFTTFPMNTEPKVLYKHEYV